MVHYATFQEDADPLPKVKFWNGCEVLVKIHQLTLSIPERTSIFFFFLLLLVHASKTWTGDGQRKRKHSAYDHQFRQKRGQSAADCPLHSRHLHFLMIIINYYISISPSKSSIPQTLYMSLSSCLFPVTLKDSTYLSLPIFSFFYFFKHIGCVEAFSFSVTEMPGA